MGASVKRTISAADAPAVLAADIGGTTARFAIVTEGRLLLHDEQPTHGLTSISLLAKRFLEKAKAQKLAPAAACVAVAGPVEERAGNTIIRMTNSPLVADQTALAAALSLPVLLINDFEAVGHAATRLTQGIVILRKGVSHPRASKVVVGAGTGLGKSILIYDEETALYRPVKSEGGHAEIPFTEEEAGLVKTLLARYKDGRDRLVYGDVLSGLGLEHIYASFRSTQFRNERLPSALSAQEIGESRVSNPCSAATFAFFTKIYARCCRNSVLETAAWGGCVIAGGIAAKNPDIFGKVFLDEFSRNPNPQFSAILRNVPIILITTTDAGLFGAAAAAERAIEQSRRRKP